MSKRNHVWVVEMLNQKTGKYEPTIGGWTTRGEAEADIRECWKKRNPDDKFRPEKYIARLTK